MTIRSLQSLLNMFLSLGHRNCTSTPIKLHSHRPRHLDQSVTSDRKSLVMSLIRSTRKTVHSLPTIELRCQTRVAIDLTCFGAKLGVVTLVSLEYAQLNSLFTIPHIVALFKVLSFSYLGYLPLNSDPRRWTRCLSQIDQARRPEKKLLVAPTSRALACPR